MQKERNLGSAVALAFLHAVTWFYLDRVYAIGILVGVGGESAHRGEQNF